jgi:hypothetical protein
MSAGGSGRFPPGKSGNLRGRPKKGPPHVSAFDIIFDKRLTVTQGSTERELTVEEALQLQTYQAALKGGRVAIRTILKMIARRDAWLAAKNPPKHKPVDVKKAHEGRTADDALLLLGIAVEMERPEGWQRNEEPLLKLQPWVVDEGLRRSRRRTISDRDMEDIRRSTVDPEKPAW